MIELNLGRSPSDELFKEGVISSVLHDAAGVDTEQIKDEWQRGAGSAIANLATINAEGLEKAKDELTTIDKKLSRNRADTRTIFARARNSTMMFPMYISQSCPINAANTICKAWERVYLSVVQSVLSQNPIIDEDEANDLVFLKKFHTNLKESADEVWQRYSNLINEFYEPIDELDRIIQESVFYRHKLTDDCYVEFRAVPAMEGDHAIMEMGRLNHEPLQGFSHYFTEASPGSTKVSEENSAQSKPLSADELRAMARDNADLTADEKECLDSKMQDYLDTHLSSGAKQSDKDAAIQAYKDNRKSAMDKVEDAMDEIKDELEKPREERDPKYKNYRLDGGRVVYSSTSKKITTEVNSSAPDAPKLIRDVDIKKNNNALPYSMEVTFRMRTKKGNFVDVRYIINVKTIMHMVRAQDIAEDLQDLITGDMKNLRKIRYKTGEISFWDYLLDLKGLKADAAKHINSSKRWLNTLKRLGEYEKLNGTLLRRPVEALTNGSVPIPNATLVLTQPDVTMITDQTGIDLSKAENAKKLAKRIFLFSVIIVDASAGTIRILIPDENDSWDVQSLASIDAETAKSDNSQLMRELNRMVNR
ncbi:MAG: hypothetical protein K2N48_08455 [Muribaculaceae bacterium]|nr:hypothetical protein [Muribaculaceae bacterium]